MKTTHQVVIATDSIMVDGQQIQTEGTGMDMLVTAYRTHIGGYPKFYKMDALSRLGFVASELLLKAEGCERFVETETRAVVMVNRTSSLAADERYHETIADRDNFFPSPAQFVYTLPNIVTGEIAIRNKYYGETMFYVVDHEDESQMSEIARSVAGSCESAIFGWLDCHDDNQFNAKLSLIDYTE